MPAEAPLPGTHEIEPQEIVARNWTEFRRAVTQLRKRFPIVTANKMYREHDRQAFGTDMPVIYELVFRGQTKRIHSPPVRQTASAAQCFQTRG
jgi:hypothetical protein